MEIRKFLIFLGVIFLIWIFLNDPNRFNVVGSFSAVKVDDSFCGDMSDAGCWGTYAPVCYRDDDGSHYYICEQVVQDCSNDPSHNLDCSRKCDNEGHIYDYSSDRCCPPLSPYYHAGLCYGTTPFDDTDNYYTRHSNCVPSCRGTGSSPAPIPDFCKPEKCIQKRSQRCETEDGWSFNYEDKGFIKGKCDVECLSGEKKCGTTTQIDEQYGNYVWECGGNYDFQYSKIEKGLCGVECFTNEDCPNNYTDERLFETFSVFRKLFVTYSNEIYTECKNYKCIEENKSIYYEFKNNECMELILYPDEILDSYYETLEECKKNIMIIIDNSSSNNGTVSTTIPGNFSDVCSQDVKSCGSGVYVSRNISLDCDFNKCPKEKFNFTFINIIIILIITIGILIYLRRKR